MEACSQSMPAPVQRLWSAKKLGYSKSELLEVIKWPLLCNLWKPRLWAPLLFILSDSGSFWNSLAQKHLCKWDVPPKHSWTIEGNLGQASVPEWSSALSGYQQSPSPSPLYLVGQIKGARMSQPGSTLQACPGLLSRVFRLFGRAENINVC